MPPPFVRVPLPGETGAAAKRRRAYYALLTRATAGAVGAARAASLTPTTGLARAKGLGSGLDGSVSARSLGPIFFVVTLLPLLAAGARRLRDMGRRGWWQLVALVPVAGIVVVAVFFAQKGKHAATS